MFPPGRGTPSQEAPASQYVSSPRAYPERLPTPDYPGHFLVKKITTGGAFRFRTGVLYLANALIDQHIGLEETDDGVWAIHFTASCSRRLMSGTTSSPADESVTHVPGLLCYRCSRLLSVRWGQSAVPRPTREPGTPRVRLRLE